MIIIPDCNNCLHCLNLKNQLKSQQLLLKKQTKLIKALHQLNQKINNYGPLHEKYTQN